MSCTFGCSSPDEPINRRLYPLGTDGGVVSWILWDQ